jgi:NAD(P)-dependent dehydrogenase (short-subunit alcohol dehydrogenase family)
MEKEVKSSGTILDRFRLDGRRALVTGGGRGLGRVIAQALAEAGADVAVASRTLSTCTAAAGEIAAATGRRAFAFAADVAMGDEVKRLVAEVESALGPIDILVNNAGINIRGASEELAEADWDTVIATNLKAPFLCARAVGPAMSARGWGRVINLGSILGVVGLPGRAPYASAKAGVINLTRVLALEWAVHGVTVNAICPGPVRTEMNDRRVEYDAKRLGVSFSELESRLTPIGTRLDPDEIVPMAVLLASDESAAITGQAFNMCGGVAT